MATISNPYADRDKVQQQISQQVPVVQQPYNLFPQEKASGYPQQVAATEPPRTVAASPVANVGVANVGGANVGGASSGGAVVQNAGSSYSQPIRSTEELARAMGYTSPEEEERLRRASVANQRIMAVADALRHIGNIYNTTHGAPAQKFNNPVLEEQTRYKQGKALRDAANAKYMTYQQQKAAQEQKQKQWETQFMYNMQKDAANYALNKSKADAQISRQKSLEELDKARREGVITQNRYNELRNEWFPKVQQATIDQKKASAAASRTNAYNNTRRTNEYIRKSKESGGSGRGNSSPVRLRGKNGFHSKKMGADEKNSFYNQTYDEMVRRDIINEGKVLEGLPGQKSVSATAKKAAVDNALMEHPEVGDWLVDEYEFELDPRQVDVPAGKPQGTNFGYETEWGKYKRQKEAGKAFGFGDMSGFSL